jgi:hypothetical protein
MQSTPKQEGAAAGGGSDELYISFTSPRRGLRNEDSSVSLEASPTLTPGVTGGSSGSAENAAAGTTTKVRSPTAATSDDHVGLLRPHPQLPDLAADPLDDIYNSAAKSKLYNSSRARAPPVARRPAPPPPPPPQPRAR